MFRAVSKSIRTLPQKVHVARVVIQKPTKGRDRDIKYETKMAHKLVMKAS